jgi:excisionase family DNA binding protein
VLQEKRRKAGVVPTLLSVREAAKALSISPATVYSLCKRGEIPHLRVSNAIRIPALVLERVRSAKRHPLQERPS